MLIRPDFKSLGTPETQNSHAYILDQIDRILVDGQVDDRTMSTDVEDGVKVGSLEARQLDSVLDELLGLFVLEELGSEFVGLEHFDRGLHDRTDH